MWLGLPCLPTISATCSEVGTGTHSVMFWLFRWGGSFRSSREPRKPPPWPGWWTDEAPLKCCCMALMEDEGSSIMEDRIEAATPFSPVDHSVWWPAIPTEEEEAAAAAAAAAWPAPWPWSRASCRASCSALPAPLKALLPAAAPPSIMKFSGFPGVSE